MGRQSPRLHVTSGAVLLSWALGCSVEPPRTEPASTPGHFGAYREVVAGALDGDVQQTRRGARDLLADVKTMDDPLVVAVGGAAGFLLVAEREELADGAVGLAKGCRSCHDDRGVVAPAPPAGDPGRVGWALVFGGPEEVAAAERTVHAAIGTPGSP